MATRSSYSETTSTGKGRGAFRFAVFAVLEILLLPMSLLGYALFVAKAVRVSKKLGLSVTALSPLISRWLQHHIGVRPDAASAVILPRLPSVSRFGLHCMLQPTLLASRVSGYLPSLLNMPSPGEENLNNMIHVRTAFFDRVLAEYLPIVEQIVVLGAGFDTRLLNLLECPPRARLFEADREATQRVKIRALQDAEFDLSGIQFASVDFKQANWLKQLERHGFDPGKRTFFLWEGVTYYLPEEAVRQGLTEMSSLSDKSNVVAFDYLSEHLISRDDSFRLRHVRKLLQHSGEMLLFGVDTSAAPETQIKTLLYECGFRLNELQLLGEASQGKAFCGLVHAIRVKPVVIY